MARRSRWAVLAGAVLLLLGVGESPGYAVQAGQYCATAAAGTITTAENGATVQCQLNATDSRYHWVAVVVTPTTIATPAPTVPAGPASQTKIISITPATTVPAPVSIAGGLLERTG